MTLLAHILELRTGMAYEQLLIERILQPLGMTSTGFEPLPAMMPRLATGHNTVLHPIDMYVYSVPDHVYVGGITSSAEDMLRFASAAMGLEPSPLLPAFQEAVKPQRFGANGKTGMAWLVTQGSYPIVYHNGHTLGMHAYFGFDPHRKIAVIVLANAAVPLDDIGPHLLYPSRYALERFTPRALGTPAPVDPDILASYTGKYRFEDMTIEIKASGDQLVLSVPDEDPFTLLAESNTRFVLVEHEASIRFLIEDGQVTGLLLDQAGASQIFTFKKVKPGE
jgi:CubicO group peptidase (beta-lactamase class C family)